MNNNNDHIATVQIVIDADAPWVWAALTDAEKIEQYMFGTTVVCDWHEGSPITWQGECNGKSFEDTGRVLTAIKNQKLVYTHASHGEEGNEHKVSITLTNHDGATLLTLEQTNNKSEQQKAEAEANWHKMLEQLKHVVEAD